MGFWRDLPYYNPQWGDGRHCRRGYKTKRNCPNYKYGLCDEHGCPPDVPVDSENIGVCGQRRHHKACDLFAARLCNSDECGPVAQNKYGRRDPRWIIEALGNLIEKISRRN